MIPASLVDLGIDPASAQRIAQQILAALGAVPLSDPRRGTPAGRHGIERVEVKPVTAGENP